MEEGIFPSYKSIGEQRELEEERRLCYVGITRAKEHLFLTCSKQRTIFGSTSCNKISRFIEEIPEELREGYVRIGVIGEPKKDTYEDLNYEWKYGDNDKIQVKQYDDKYSSIQKPSFQYRTAESFLNSLTQKIGRGTTSDPIDLTKYKVGQTVSHKKFGIGIISKIEKEGDDLKVDINFEKAGSKRLMAKFAGLEIIE